MTPRGFGPSISGRRVVLELELKLWFGKVIVQFGVY